VYLAPGASIESVVPSFKVVIRPDSLSIYAPDLRGEDRAFNPRGLYVADQLLQGVGSGCSPQLAKRSRNLIVWQERQSYQFPD